MTHPVDFPPPDSAGSARRVFLKQLAAASGSLPLGKALAGGTATALLLQSAEAGAAPSGKPVINTVYGYESFGPDEAAFVEAMLNIMCPADHFTPNGVDCGLAIYIDRQLAGSFGQGARRYAAGPFLQGAAQCGPQLPLTPEQYFKAGIAEADRAAQRLYGQLFDALTPQQGDAFLQQLAAGQVAGEQLDLAEWFNALVYPLFAEACFADPLYGGNVGMVFWKMIGYPGLPATHALDVVQYLGKPYPGAAHPKSIADFS
ncbi:gluconate 2-dehydrogenase subunit 3 family protein [Aquitalea sp. LB_tupeE]|uniref:gluconate 2-dehydrogenase subunit 3 family protein n=1 Tax=Aquitalea sp. LB_tupeE TaxID=2748078 RepID=UPI0015C04D4A|nr:gluconate 2-dehydrogenase subunit 3 family protein [Aquitalea sp. LB_tupeE]NWK77638.1 gluconate 2-dehydrogenase subunit 3 family protein [Aquitalea sp. LB_tupeE]